MTFKPNAPVFLTADLEAALLRELFASWKQINKSLFQEALAPPLLTLGLAQRRLGQWQSPSRVLELSRPLIFEQPWAVVLEVLKHEMVHQYVDEVLHIQEETPHGPTFQKICITLGVDPAAQGLPTAPQEAQEEEKKRPFQRILKLLALAESQNRYEAEAAAAAAQRLILKYNLSMDRSGLPASYRFRQLGEPKGRIFESERVLSVILTHHFFVEALWIPAYIPAKGKRGNALEISGTPENLDMAAYVYAFLTRTAEQLWLQHKKEKSIRSNRERRTFLAGVMNGFLDKLSQEKVKNEGEGLVWVKDSELSAYFRRRHPLIRHVRYAGQKRSEMYALGRAVGKRIVLHRAMHAPTGQQGRLLPPSKHGRAL